MASNRYRNRAGNLKPEAWHLVTITTETGSFERVIRLRQLESFKAAKIRIARAYSVRAQRITIGSRVEARETDPNQPGYSLGVIADLVSKIQALVA